MAKDMDVRDLAETATSLGFGKKTGIDLVGEKTGPDAHARMEESEIQQDLVSR